jgi:hypothetical protein
MAGLLYTYSVTSIRAAKLNAQRHREADGGQLNMRNESLRQRGWLERPASDRETFVASLRGEKIKDVRGDKDGALMSGEGAKGKVGVGDWEKRIKGDGGRRSE